MMHNSRDTTRTPEARATTLARRQARRAKFTARPLDFSALASEMVTR